MEKAQKRINLSTPTMHGEEMDFVKQAFEKNWIAPLGFNCDNFEKEACDYIANGISDKKYALALCSGTSALHLAIKLAGVKRGDVVFCSDMTFAATVNPVSYEGGVQVFIDSEEETWNMDPVALEKAFEKYPNAKVVMLAHLYGTPSKMDEIIAVCKKHNAILIEDAAESLSATYKGVQTGTFGKYSAISFNGNKIITTSGGGMLFTDSQETRDKAFFLATQAREPALWYQHEEIGYNYRMSNVVAGIGRGQLLHLEEHKQRKAEIYARYKKGFEGLPVKMNPYLECSSPNFWLSCITIDEGCPVDAIEVIKRLAELNVEARPIWKPMHMQPVFKGHDFISAYDTPVNEKIFRTGLCLPSDIKMTQEEQDFVINSIKAIFKEQMEDKAKASSKNINQGGKDMFLTLMYITNNPEVALIAEKNGVDRVWIDLEILGKEERQKGRNTVKSHHTVEDVAKIKKVLTKAQLQVRINPWNDNSLQEIEDVIFAGAQVIMLPMWKTPQETSAFISAVNGRATTSLLLETKEAVDCIDEVLANQLPDEIHIGLNDLHISYDMNFLFEPLANGMVDALCEKIRKAGIPYGFGGVAKIGEGELPAEKVILEHHRLGSTRAILSRSFCNAEQMEDITKLKQVFADNMGALRESCAQVQNASNEQIQENKLEIKNRVEKIVAKIC